MNDDLPLAPEPDAKDWTWVLEETCPDCGFDAAAMDPTQTGRLLRDNVEAWREVLDGDAAALRERPEPAVWSALEYACHVRDVYVLFGERLALMRAEEGPHFANWDQDQTAIESRYDLAEPSEVQDALVIAGQRLADDFDSIGDAEWERTGFRSDGAAFTVASFAKYFLHDPVHHLHDLA